MAIFVYPVHQFSDFRFFIPRGRGNKKAEIENIKILEDCFNKNHINPALFNSAIILERFTDSGLFWLSGPILDFLELKGLKFERTKLYEKLKPTLVFNNIGD